MKISVMSLLCLAVCGGVGSGQVHAATPTATTKLEATLTSGTCNVGFTPASVPLGDISLDSIKGSSGTLGGGWSPPTDITVKLTECGVGGDAGLTVSGDVVGTSTEDQKRMFRASSSTSVGFGVLIFTKEPPSPSDGQWTNVVYPGDTIRVSAADIADGHKDISLWAAVTCGDQTGCSAASLRAGTLDAAVTFKFAYK